jgi:hypothetical protein
MKGILISPKNHSDINEVEFVNQEEIYDQVCKTINAEVLDCRTVDRIENRYHLIMYADDNGYEKILSFNEIPSLIYSNGKDHQCIRGSIVLIIEDIETNKIASFDMERFDSYLQKKTI